VTDEAVIRPALREDAPTLANLRYAFRAALNEPAEAEAAFVARCTTWMAARLAPGTPWRCWLAEVDRAVVGQLWVQLIEKIPNPGPELEHHAYITNVYVDPAARGGLGEQLLAAAVAFCRERSVDSVVLWPTDRSRSLYARSGFATPTDMMEAVLDTNRHL
jgi:ribosomal protein S18 acetylase RimI-like enzyme